MVLAVSRRSCDGWIKDALPSDDGLATTIAADLAGAYIIHAPDEQWSRCRSAPSCPDVPRGRKTAMSRSPSQISTSCVLARHLLARYLALCSSMRSDFAAQIGCRLLSTRKALHRIAIPSNNSAIEIEWPPDAAPNPFQQPPDLCTCGHFAIDV